MQDSPSRSTKFENRYRLYIDESGDHVFRKMDRVQHRFLCLLGCRFQNPNYLRFHESLECLKSKHFPHHPDEPVILHREDMLNARKVFKSLREAKTRARFDKALLRVIKKANFTFVAVVIDKLVLRQEYIDAAAHPYHLGLGFLLQRYVGYLNHINRVGDVMAESRGGKEDRLLQESYTRIYEHGVWVTEAHTFKAALTSRQLKIKPKFANISGLQLADLLGHPIKQWVLQKYGFLSEELAPFALRIIDIAEAKFNRHLYEGRIEGYGYVLYPKK